MSMVATVLERTESISPTDEARRSMSEDTFANGGLYVSSRVMLLSLLSWLCNSGQFFASQNQHQSSSVLHPFGEH